MTLHILSLAACSCCGALSPALPSAPRRSPRRRAGRAAGGAGREGAGRRHDARGRGVLPVPARAHLESEGDVRGRHQGLHRGGAARPEVGRDPRRTGALYARENRFDEAMKNGRGGARHRPRQRRAPTGVLGMHLRQPRTCRRGQRAARRRGAQATPPRRSSISTPHGGSAERPTRPRHDARPSIYLRTRRVRQGGRASAARRRRRAGPPRAGQRCWRRPTNAPGSTDEAIEAARGGRRPSSRSSTDARRVLRAPAAVGGRGRRLRAGRRADPTSLDLRTRLAVGAAVGGGDAEAARASTCSSSCARRARPTAACSTCWRRRSARSGDLDDAEATARELMTRRARVADRGLRARRSCSRRSSSTARSVETLEPVVGQGRQPRRQASR